MKEYPTTSENCYVCGRKLRPGQKWEAAYLEDDDHARVPVGPDCLRRIVAATSSGYQSPRGGPRLFATAAFAKIYVQNLAAYHGDIDGDFNY